MTSTIYLDYAATAAIRPPEVVEAVAAYLRDVGATPGRSGHGRALAAGRVALRCRKLLAELFGIGGDPGRIVFQANATHALNTALFGLVRAGDLVVRTRCDHNAVRRPVGALVRGGARERVLDLGRDGSVDLGLLEHLLTVDGGPARLLVLPHASNVLGVVLPVREMARLAHEAGALVLLDAAQTAGHYPIDVADLEVDLMAFTGHKGLLGPQGIGGLWVAEGVAVEPLIWGGTGTDSDQLEMPAAYPDHLEAGTQNGPGIAGLAAGAEWVLGRGVAELHRRELALRTRLVDALRRVSGVRICSPTTGDGVGLVTLLVDGLDPGDLSLTLDREHGVQGRAGLHCAPEAHDLLGTGATGAFRLSLGWATTEEEIDRTADAFRRIGSEGREP
jgi:cysteine desulfurase / selenocysteine lyase